LLDSTILMLYFGQQHAIRINMIKYVHEFNVCTL
jgi:hypothetical protein